MRLWSLALTEEQAEVISKQIAGENRVEATGHIKLKK
jgi:hypothetical protein